MQNLVLKNPVQRFKQGRKIIKAQFGYRTRNDGVIVNAAGTPIGRSIRENSYEYEKGFPEDKLILNGLYQDASTGAIFSPNKKNGVGDYIEVLPGPSPIQNGTYYETKNASGKIIERGRYFGEKKHPLPIGPSPLSSKQKIIKKSGVDKNGNPIRWNEDENGNFISGQYVSDDGNTYWYGSDGSKTLIKRGNPKTVDSPKTITKQPINYQFGKMGGWSRSIGKGTINDPESLRMLKEMGMEKYSAGQVQDEINKQFGSNAVKRDDRWGNQSRAGLRSLYENWKLQNNNSSINTDINLPSKTLNSVIVNKEPITPTQITEQAIVNNNVPTIENNGQKYFARTGNYNKSQLRGYMRSMGLNPYDFTGSERRALRLWLNGQSNDNSLLTGRLRDLFVTPYGYKQGGQLVSRNPIQRFKTLKKK